MKKKFKKRVFSGYSYGIGRLIHNVIEEFAKNSVKSAKFIGKLDNGTDKEIEQEFIKGIRYVFTGSSKAKKLYKWPVSEIEIVGKGLDTIAKDMTQRFLGLKRDSGSKEALKRLFIAIEWSFNHTFQTNGNSVELGGRIDWLSVNPDTGSIILWDFKTSPPENLERDLMQVAIYSTCVEEKFGVPVAAALYYIHKGRITNKIVEPEVLVKFKPRIIENLRKMSLWIRNEEIPPHTQYKEICEECIVTTSCIQKFGYNPNLEALGIIVDSKVNILTEDMQEAIEEEEDLSRESVFVPEKAEIHFDYSYSVQASKKSTDHNITLGKSLQTRQPLELNPLVLNRHGTILGASGSGKTVLGKVIIEEILQQGQSAILIDPQGDLCSLALADSEKGENIIKNVPITIFTPNSRKGKLLTIDLLAPPAKETLNDQETLRVFLDATATQLLNILGYNLRKIPNEKAFLEAILKEDWIKGRKLSLKTLAQRIKKTTLLYSVQDNSTVEVEDLLSKRSIDKLSKSIMKLAIGTDGSFFSEGNSLELDKLISNSPQLHIINLASVGTDQNKRQLVVSWILREIYDWLLRNPQRDQDRIRFFLYIDEVADFLPPHPYNPPSKQMLMLLMRQARKYGCSCIIATQSPATIDYKALDNVGTLFIGKIPSKQSRDKIEAFLEPYGYHVQQMVKKLQTVKTGEFLLIGGGYTEPELFKTRWLHTKHQTMSLEAVEEYMKSKLHQS